MLTRLVIASAEFARVHAAGGCQLVASCRNVVVSATAQFTSPIGDLRAIVRENQNEPQTENRHLEGKRGTITNNLISLRN